MLDETKVADLLDGASLNGSETIDRVPVVTEESTVEPTAVGVPNTGSEAIELVINPELKALIPWYSQEALDGLKKNLQNYGCLDSIAYFEFGGRPTLLDGHHRYELCKELRIPFKTVRINIPDLNEAKIWIIEHQASRRNLKESQRALLAAKLVPMYELQGLARQVRGTTNPSLNLDEGEIGRSDERAGKLLSVSHQTVAYAVKVLKKNNPDLIKMVEDGSVAVSTAAKICRKPDTDFQRIIASGAKAVKEAVKRASDKPDNDEAKFAKFETALEALHDMLCAIGQVPHPETITDARDTITNILRELDRLGGQPIDQQDHIDHLYTVDELDAAAPTVYE